MENNLFKISKMKLEQRSVKIGPSLLPLKFLEYKPPTPVIEQVYHMLLQLH